MRATWSTAGALAALALPATAVAADAPTVVAPASTTPDAVVVPAPSVAEPAPAAPPAVDPAATVPPGATPPTTVPPARGEPGDAAGPTGPGGAGGAKDPAPGSGSTGSADAKDDRERKAKRDEKGSEGRKDGKDAKDADGKKADRKDDEKSDDPSDAQSASSAADLLLGGATRGLADLSVKDFRIPPFLLPIYQAAGVQYGIRWEILAAINEIETDYGRNLSVSTAGALGWMQFMPGTWKAYGVDATGDGQRDPYNPVDAIFAAARYLQASGAATDIRKAIFAYNHADWYVNDVLRRAQAIAKLPTEVVESLAGLTLAQLPVYAPNPAAAADEPEAPAPDAADGDDATGASESDDAKGTTESDDAIDAKGETGSGDAKDAEARVSLVTVAPGGPTAWATVRAPEDAPVVAVQDATVTRLGESPRWGRYVELRDAYGNRYTYAQLGEVAREHLVSRRGAERTSEVVEARATTPTATSPMVGPSRPQTVADSSGPTTPPPVAQVAPDVRAAPDPGARSDVASDPEPDPPTASSSEPLVVDEYVVRASGLRAADLRRVPLRVGSKVMAGTILGKLDPDRTRVDAGHDQDQGQDADDRRSVSSLRFAIRPAGEGSGRIDPRPILDGWRLLDDAAVFGNELPPALAADRDDQPDVGRVLLLSKPQLQQRVLANPRLEIYAAGRDDIRAGVIDRRVLATMEYLTAHGLRLTITSLRSGHSYLSASGNVSAHSYGSAMDIAVVNGTVISPATQGPGSITDRTNRLLLRLQGTMRPNQIISLMTYPGTDNTLAMADHDDHIHVGFPRAAAPDDGPVRLASLKVGDTTLAPGLRRDQWESLMDQLGSIENPTVTPKVSSSALPDPKARKIKKAKAEGETRAGR